MKIAILGGTGNEGKGLGYRWAAAGHEIIIGSRSAEKGARAAAEMCQTLPDAHISGTDNRAAAHEGEIVVLSVPYDAQEDTLDGVKDLLQGKLLLTVVVPLGSQKARYWRTPSGLSAAEEAQQQLGEGVRVVAAFHNISAVHMEDPYSTPDCDVLVCGEKRADRDVVLQLCADARMRGVSAGVLQNAAVAEGLTCVLLGINIRYKINNAGIRITGLPEEQE
jgi:NADPH-dependent F420 reductase